MWTTAAVILALAVNSMSLLVKRGDFQMTTGIVGTVLQIRGVGFQGKAVLFWWNGRDGTVDASGEASFRSGFGFACGLASRRCATFSSMHANTEGATGCVMRDDACIVTLTAAATTALEGLGDFTAWDPDGFDITIDDAFAAVFRVHYLVLGGTDIKDVEVATFTTPATTGDVDYTVGSGWQPDLMCFLTVGNTIGSIYPHGQFSLGFAAGGSTNQMVYSAFILDGGASSDTYNYCRRGESIVFDKTFNRLCINTFLETGFRLNATEVNSPSSPAFYLAIRGGRYKVSGLLTSVTNAASIVTTGLGHSPKALIFLSGCQAETGLDANTTQQTCSIGCATGSGEQAAMGFQDKHAQATTDVWTDLDYDKVYVNPDVAATQAVEGLAALASIDGDGFTLTMTDGDPAQLFLGAVSCGDAPPLSDEDLAGLLMLGADVYVTDEYGVTGYGKLASAQAAYGDTADVTILRVVGSAIQAVTLTNVAHKSAGLAPPHWVSFAGERTAPAVLVS